MNRATISEGVECVFGFTKKCFCVARDELHQVPMKGLASKPLRIHLVYPNEMHMEIKSNDRQRCYVDAPLRCV